MSNATKILGVMYGFQTGLHADSQDDLVYTARLLAELAGLSLDSAESAIEDLLLSGFISKNKTLSEYRVTQEGIDHYEAAKLRTQIDRGAETFRFRDEVLTGGRMCHGVAGAVLEPTDIDKAVLNRATSHRAKTLDPERRLLEKQEVINGKKKMADILNLSFDRFCKLWDEGRIKICNGHDDHSHLGVFDKRGDGLQYLCRECRKYLRKKRR